MCYFVYSMVNLLFHFPFSIYKKWEKKLLLLFTHKLNPLSFSIFLSTVFLSSTYYHVSFSLRSNSFDLHSSYLIMLTNVCKDRGRNKTEKILVSLGLTQRKFCKNGMNKNGFLRHLWNIYCTCTLLFLSLSSHF